MAEQCISVIVPTYQRAQLLNMTLPSYLQPETYELIVVDDCSQDATAKVVHEIATRDARVRYLKSPRNLKQPHAKNMGIAEARAPYVYFGDDDSLLLSGSLAYLLETMKNNNADIVGARAPYMIDKKHIVDAERLFSLVHVKSSLEARWQTIINPFTLQAHFDRAVSIPIQVPFTHAAFLVSRSLAADIQFDEYYTGNCFREETDFLIRAYAQGAQIWYDSRAVQVNLPRSYAEGGAHTGSKNFVLRKLQYFSSALRNNWRFLIKNREALSQATAINVPPVVRQSIFFAEVCKIILSYPLRKVIGREL